MTSFSARYSEPSHEGVLGGAVRRPRDLHTWLPAKEAIASLRQLAQHELARAKKAPKDLKIKWDIKINYWTEEWSSKKKKEP
jgi:hypothetical protein